MGHYIALIRKDPESDYSVSFPDFPGCVTAGSTLVEARAFAEEALSFHIEGMIEDGEAVPEPSGLEAIIADPENWDAFPALVAVGIDGVRTAADVTLPEDILAEIDRYAHRRGLSRSEFLARAAKRAMEQGAA
jgi:predicted RNase H-like HicB family nuclease